MFSSSKFSQVKCESGTQYLTAVCMGCLEGVSPDRVIRCRFVKNLFYLFKLLLIKKLIIFRFCSQKWDGSSLVLGTMYSYDIFAAMPCCTERLKVSFFNLNIKNLIAMLKKFIIYLVDIFI